MTRRMRTPVRSRFFLVALVASLVAGCAGGGGGGDGGDAIAVEPSTRGGTSVVLAGETLDFQANVTNAANSNDATWSLSGPACPSQCGTIVRTGIGTATYTAPAVVAVAFQVMVTATSVEDLSRSGSFQLSVEPKVCPPNAALLSGSYALLLQGFGDTPPYNAQAAVGSITADACGRITAGQVDYGPNPAGSATGVSGSYSIGNDRRGTLSLSLSGLTKTFAIAVGRVSGGAATRGGLTESTSTGNNRLSGTLWRQDAAALALDRVAGDYAYLLSGWRGSASGGWAGPVSGPRWAVGGTVSLDTAGHFGVGIQDRMVFNGMAVIGRAWTATTTAFSSASGRAVLSAGAFDGLGDAVAYIVNAGQWVVLVSDAAGNVLSGSLVVQSGGPFGPASLKGTVVTNQTAHHMGMGYYAMAASSLGVFDADGASPIGTLSARYNDSNSGCNISRNMPALFGYQVASNGQVSISSGAALVGKHYLIAPNTGFMLGLDAGVSVGAIRPRAAGPFSPDSFSGSYYASQAVGVAAGAVNSSGVASFASTGALVATMDTNVGGTVGTSLTRIGGSLVDTGDGRFTDAYGNVIYAVAPSDFLVVSAADTECYPTVLLFDR